MKHPANKFVVGFMGSPAMNVMSCTIKEEAGNLMAVNKGMNLTIPTDQTDRLKPYVNQDLYIGLRPGHIRDSVADGQNKNGSAFKAFVRLVEPLGSEQLVHLEAEDHRFIARIDPRSNLKESLYLQFRYSRPEFAVFNIYRWYHGYFDHNPAHLLPRPDKEVNGEINALIAGPDKILKRAEELNKTGKPQLALQVLDILFKEDPDYPGARELHLDLLEQLCEADGCLMSRSTWVYFMEQDRAVLKEKSYAKER